MKKDENEKIKCSVYSCKHCDNDKECCTLESIKVCNCTSDDNKESTMCDSFKKENTQK